MCRILLFVAVSSIAAALPPVIRIGFLIASTVLTSPSCNFQNLVALSKEEFCSGRKNVRVNPKYIPELIDYLNICIGTSIGNSSKQEVVARLFDAATPIVHKAFFDSKTGLKEVSLFTKLKNGFIQLTSERFYNRVLKKSQNDHLMIYSPKDDQGSYIIEDDIRMCSKILNNDAGVKNIIRSGELPQVAKSEQTITFRPLNITIGTNRDDVPYLILDTYVLATRCLSFTNMLSETAAMVSRRLIRLFKDRIMPYIEPKQFERAYSRMMSLVDHHENVRIESPELPNSRSVHHYQFPEIPFNFELNLEVPNADGDGGISTEETCVQCDDSDRISSLKPISTTEKTTPNSARESYFYSQMITGWTLKEPFDIMGGKLKPIQVIHEKGTIMKDFESFVVACHDKMTIAAFVITAAVVGCLLTLAAVIYCLVRGYCGYVTVWPKGEEGYDDEAYDLYNNTDTKKTKGPSFWRLPFGKNKDSKMTRKSVEDDLENAPVSNEPAQEEGFSGDKKTGNTDDEIIAEQEQVPEEEINYEDYFEQNLKASLFPEKSESRFMSPGESTDTSDESTGDLVIPNPNRRPRIRRDKRKDPVNPVFCTFTDSNQVEVLATLHKRCEVLSKRICEVVRDLTEDTVFEGSPSMESLRKFVRSVSHEVVHDSDTISSLRSTSLDPLIPLSQ